MRHPPLKSRVFLFCGKQWRWRQGATWAAAQGISSRKCLATGALKICLPYADLVCCMTKNMQLHPLRVPTLMAPQHPAAAMEVQLQSTRAMLHTCISLLKPRPCRMEAARTSAMSLSSASSLGQQADSIRNGQ